MPSLASKAHRKVGEALWAGKLVVPDNCELCDNTLCYSHAAHHWNGYENPLDVWFICRSCNSLLRAKKFHNGTTTKEQARAIVLAKRNPVKPQVFQCEAVIESGRRCKNRVIGSTLCNFHKESTDDQAPTIAALIEIVSQLSEADQAEVLRYAKYRKQESQ